MRKLSQIKQNKFTVKLKDAFFTLREENKKEIESVHLVMDYYEHDMRTLINTQSSNLAEEHLIILTYNLLCAVNFMHSANLFHRDIKPANILVTPNCTI